MTKRQHHGFTIIETMLAVAFVAILMMAILVLTITAGKMYVKGNTNQTINQAGRDFSDTVRRDFLSAGVGTVSPVISISGGSTTAYSGRVCLGTVAYLWNSASLINTTTALANTARVTMGSGSGTPVTFARVVNPKQSYCDKDATGKYPMNIPTGSTGEQVTDLFAGDGRDYALYAMKIQAIASSGDSGLYRITYTLGTNEKDTTQQSAEGYTQCRPSNDASANFTYCAVEDFDMIVRVGGAQ